MFNTLDAVIAFSTWDGVILVLSVQSLPSSLKCGVINISAVIPLGLWVQVVLNNEWLIANLLDGSDVVRVVLKLFTLNGVISHKIWLVEAPQSSHVTRVTVVRSVIPVWTENRKSNGVSAAVLNVVT